MANLFDYLLWRGDLSLAQSPFNEVDNLVLSMLTYMDLTGVVPPPEDGGSVTVADAAARFFEGREDAHIKLGLLIPDDTPYLFRRLPECPRFADFTLSNYVNHVDERAEEQFSALTIGLPDGSEYVAFRGTDDTLVGWKENFNMSFCDAVPAQLEAVAYLRDAALRGSGALRAGGHSKGGNLAVYAAMHAEPEVQARILDVYNNDGPGFQQSVIDEPGYKSIRARVKTLIPQTAIVGMLMEHEEAVEVVKSRAIGPFQHDGFTWEVERAGFVRLGEVTEGCRYIDRTLKAWMDDIDPETRRAFIDALFDLFQSTGATTLTDLTAGSLKNAATLIQTYRHLDRATRENLRRTMRLLLRESAREVRLKKPEKAVAETAAEAES